MLGSVIVDSDRLLQITRLGYAMSSFAWLCFVLVG
jgi:hypothetical protein